MAAETYNNDKTGVTLPQKYFQWKGGHIIHQIHPRIKLKERKWTNHSKTSWSIHWHLAIFPTQKTLHDGWYILSSFTNGHLKWIYPVLTRRQQSTEKNNVMHTLTNYGTAKQIQWWQTYISNTRQCIIKEVVILLMTFNITKVETAELYGSSSNNKKRKKKN